MDEDDVCPENNGSQHEPDWNSVVIQHDGGVAYVDVQCIFCDQRGTLGPISKLKVTWE